MRGTRTFFPRLALSLGALALALAARTQEAPPAVLEALKQADATVEAIVRIPDGQRTFENTLGALDAMSVRIENATNLPIFMQYVSSDAKERDSARAAEEAVGNWGITLGKREDLYRAVKAYAATNPKLEGEQKRFLEFTLRDYRRAGMDLPKEQRDRLAEIERQQNKLAQDFNRNIYEDPTFVTLTKGELKGIPEDVLKGWDASEGLYIVRLDGPSVDAVLNFADQEVTRQKVWFALKRKGGQKNVDLLEQLIKLRAEQAKLLGYASYADYAVETRMAKNAAKVDAFYAQLRPIVRKKAQLDWDEFVAEKRRATKNPKATLYPWDFSYIQSQLMKRKYSVDEEKVAEYFPMQNVVDGLFSITQSLYGISYKDVTADAGKLGLPVWHPDVKLYEVSDKGTGETIGHFYIDLYPRENKYNHAACWSLRSRKVWADGSVQKPLAALVCNFTKPTADKPSLLPHDQVETFFHEFGHALHNLLAEAKYARFSGASVALDFVEAPSQMFENWVWDAKVLGTFAKHYKTGQPLPESLLTNMAKARTLGSGLLTEHQIYYGVVDQRYHTAKDGLVDTSKVGVDALGELELYKSVPGTFYQAGFGHLAGGYQAAYYGYQWSLVYSADMFQRFREKGLLSPEAGMYYRRKILAKGGSEDENAMLRDYLGREPNLDAYLEQLGIRK